MFNSNDVHVVACCYSFTAQELRVALIQLALKLKIRFVGVIVDNKRRELPADDGDWIFIHGSNSDHDFSAYLEGLSRSTALTEVILFLNDSLFISRGAFVNLRELMYYKNLLAQLQVPAICGRTDRYTMLCHRNVWSHLPMYVSSYGFMLNRFAFATLLALPSYADTDGVRRDLDVSHKNWGANLPANFREFIRAFIQYGHPAFAWPGLRRYAVDERLFAIKARCIYFEHRLSGEISRDGCLISTNTRLIPRWRIYLAEKLTSWRGLRFFQSRIWWGR
jgi:hypothetical protein